MNRYGINFPVNEVQFGKSVHFLDVILFIDENNRIQYRSYSKPTDAKRYLRPQSFHPKNVFTSVPLSQMIRTIERNSSEDTRTTEMEKMKEDFVRSGYKREDLERIERRAREMNRGNHNQEENSTLTFPLFFFDQIRTFKKILKDSATDLRTLIGDTKITMAVKKNPSIGNTVVRNKMSFEEKDLDTQKCGATNCLQCPLVSTNNVTMVNNMRLKTSRKLNCKSRNIIYLWQCNTCNEENSYFGRTIQKSHKRTNTHRSCFTETKWEESALSMHSHRTHQENFSLSDFSITLVKKCSPQTIRREEFKFIDKYRTRTRGINRYKN